ARDRISSDNRFGTGELDFRELRGALKERLGRNANARSNRASEVLTFLCDEAEGRGGAEIHDDHRTAVSVESGSGIDNAISADFRRVLVPQRQPGLQLGRNGKRETVKIFFSKFFE